MRVRVLSKLEGMGPRPPVVGLTFGEKWAIFFGFINREERWDRY